MSLKIELICDKGCIRPNNEDHVLVIDKIFTDGKRFIDLPHTQRIFVAVADGMGGHNAGEVASKMVLESLQHYLELMDEDISFMNFEIAIGKWVEVIHSELLQAGDASPSLTGMGTTLTGLYWGKKGKYVFNAGDSRTYLYNNGTIKQVTQDHSLRSNLDSTGIKSNLLINCIGAVKNAFLDVFDVSEVIIPGTIILLCSDGLTDMLNDQEIKRYLNPVNLHELVEEAKNRGGRDNISVISLHWAIQE